MEEKPATAPAMISADQIKTSPKPSTSSTPQGSLVNLMPPPLHRIGFNVSKRKGSGVIPDVVSSGVVAGRYARRIDLVTCLDSDDSDNNGEDAHLSDEEVQEFDPDYDDYIELPRAKGEPPPETIEMTHMNPERLTNFKNLYLSQPKEIRELIKIPFYKGNPVVQPPPLATTMQKVKAFKGRRKADDKKRMKMYRESYIAAMNQLNAKALGDQAAAAASSEKNRTKEAKVNIFEVYEADSQLIHVDFPAGVKNPDKAIQMLGGYNTINKVFNNVKKKLPVRFRPDDPFCNAANGDPYPTVGLLLRVRRRKLLTKPKKMSKKINDDGPIVVDVEHDTNTDVKSVLVNGIRMTKDDILREDRNLVNKSGREMDEYVKRFRGKETPEQYYIKIPDNYQPKKDDKVKIDTLGIVSRTYKFNGICDFQYLPMADENGKLVSKRDCVLPFIGSPGENIDDMFVSDRIFGSEDGEVERFLVPPMMSRVDKPLDAVIDHFLDSDQVKLAPDLQRQKLNDTIRSSRTKRNVYTMFHSFQPDNSSAPVPQEPLPEALDDLSKRRLEGSLGRLKACFEIRPIWSRIALECETQLEDITLKYALPCVAYFANNGPWRTLWIRLGYDPRLDQSTFLYQTVDYRVPFIYKQYIEEKDKSDDTSFRFRQSVMPPRAQAFYQLCDIKLDEVERLVEIASKKVGTDLVYDHKYGWLKEGTFEYLRQVMNQYIELHLEDLGKIPEQPPFPKMFLNDGELEPTEKFSYKRRMAKRFRKTKLKPPSALVQVNVEPSSNKKPTPTSPSKSSKSKNKKVTFKTSSTGNKPAPGTLPDLKIKDMDKDKEKESVLQKEDENNSEDDEDFDFLFDDTYVDEDEDEVGSNADEDDDEFPEEASEEEAELEQKEVEIEQILKQEVDANEVGNPNDEGEED